MAGVATQPEGYRQGLKWKWMVMGISGVTFRGTSKVSNCIISCVVKVRSLSRQMLGLPLTVAAAGAAGSVAACQVACPAVHVQLGCCATFVVGFHAVRAFLCSERLTTLPGEPYTFDARCAAKHFQQTMSRDELCDTPCLTSQPA